jgi:hypothetical protein
MLSAWRLAAMSRSTVRASLGVTIFSKYNICFWKWLLIEKKIIKEDYRTGEDSLFL